MKRILILTIITLLHAQQSVTIDPEPKHSIATNYVNNLVKVYHYNKVKLDNKLSSRIYDQYLEDLDYYKVYFLKSDLSNFEQYRYQMDDFINTGDVRIAYDLFNVYRTRFLKRLEFIDKTIDSYFDFNKEEKFNYNRDNAEWAFSNDELDEYWRKRIKNEALRLKLSGKKKEKIQELLKTRYNNQRRRMMQNKSDDIFQIFMNSYLTMYDPHTNYLSPRISENFNIQMKLSLEGIGARLTPQNEYTKVAEIVKGGPADKMGQLHADDKIIAVGQDEQEMVDVIGWRLDDVVQLIRGPKGSKVRLEIIPAGETINDRKIIEIVRDKVKLEDQAASYEVKEIKEDGESFRIGVINLPSFYIDFEALNRDDPNYRSTTRDVRRILGELKEKNVQGVLIDLRNNGGGSLREAIELTGLFIDEGPVVMVKNSQDKINVHKDFEEGTIYDGPLVVLINERSASASEIFSGAIQDYHRGIIVGDQSYGKGTVQRMINLDQYLSRQKMKNGKKFPKIGELKITLEKFYRVNGSSTQHKGVIPDIRYPSYYMDNTYGESSFETALEWDQIDEADFDKVADLNRVRVQLNNKHVDRIEDNIDFKLLMKDIEEFQSKDKDAMISLNEKNRLKEQKERKQKEFNRENERRKAKGLTLLKKGEKVPKNTDDFFLDEATRILANLVDLKVF